MSTDRTIPRSCYDEMEKRHHWQSSKTITELIKGAMSRPCLARQTKEYIKDSLLQA